MNVAEVLFPHMMALLSLSLSHTFPRRCVDIIIIYKIGVSFVACSSCRLMPNHTTASQSVSLAIYIICILELILLFLGLYASSVQFRINESKQASATRQYDVTVVGL